MDTFTIDVFTTDNVISLNEWLKLQDELAPHCSVIMAMAGHKTESMFLRYNTVEEQDMRMAVERFGSYLRGI